MDCIRKLLAGMRVAAPAWGILLAAAFLWGYRAEELAAQSSTPYGRAVKLAEEGKESAAEAEVNKARLSKRNIDVSATVLILSDNLLSELGVEVRKYIVPGANDPGAVRVNVRPRSGEEPKWSLQVTPRSEEQVSSLNDVVRQSSRGAVVSLFSTRVCDMQQAEIRLVPDQGFPVIGADGQPEFDMVRDRGEFVKKIKLAQRAIPISIRPVANDDGHETWLRFFDDSRSFDPAPPASLSETIGWSFPGNRKVALGVPEYELSADKTGSVGYVRVPPSGQLMVSGIMAIGGERVRQGLPILDMIPVVGETVFSSQSTIHYRISVCVVLDVQPAR